MYYPPPWCRAHFLALLMLELAMWVVWLMECGPCLHQVLKKHPVFPFAVLFLLFHHLLEECVLHSQRMWNSWSWTAPKLHRVADFSRMRINPEIFEWKKSGLLLNLSVLGVSCYIHHYCGNYSKYFPNYNEIILEWVNTWKMEITNCIYFSLMVE